MQMHAICLSLAYQTKLGTMVTDQPSEGPPHVHSGHIFNAKSEAFTYLISGDQSGSEDVSLEKKFS